MMRRAGLLASFGPASMAVLTLACAGSPDETAVDGTGGGASESSGSAASTAGGAGTGGGGMSSAATGGTGANSGGAGSGGSNACAGAGCGDVPCFSGKCVASWLQYANAIRAQSGAPPVAEDAALSAAAALHAQYIVGTDEIGHSEEPGSAYYTPEGNGAAERGLPWGLPVQADYDRAFQTWQQAPFHLLHILDPAYPQFGYGEHHDASSPELEWGVTLVVRSADFAGPAGGPYTQPILFPGDGAESVIASYWGETPSPLSACAGYAEPAGLPLIASFGRFAGAQQIVGTELVDLDTGAPVEHCSFDETSYTFPDSNWMAVAVQILDAYEAIVLIPRDPLTPGHSYRATVSSTFGDVTWTFTVSPTAT